MKVSTFLLFLICAALAALVAPDGWRGTVFSVLAAQFWLLYGAVEAIESLAGDKRSDAATIERLQRERDALAQTIDRLVGEQRGG